MTRKDYAEGEDALAALYEKIADVFKKSKPTATFMETCEYSPEEAQLDTWLNLVHNMTDMLADDNPRFDRDKFLKACGVE